MQTIQFTDNFKRNFILSNIDLVFEFKIDNTNQNDLNDISYNYSLTEQENINKLVLTFANDQNKMIRI